MNLPPPSPFCTNMPPLNPLIKQLQRCAVIGSGPSGIVSAKYCTEYDITPVVFERKSLPGGLWSEGTAIWDDMHTNVSRFSVMFSDFPWPEDANIVPSAKEVFSYLKSYIKHFNLEECFRYNTKVENVKQLSDDKWQLTYVETLTGEKTTETFDFLICATGLHSYANIPKIEGAEMFEGTIMHSLNYRSKDERLKNKRVIVVGNSYSGVEISTHLVSSGHVSSLINVFNRPYLVLPRLLKLKCANEQKNTYNIIPIDLFFGRELTQGSSDRPNWQQAEREEKIRLYSKLCPLQTNVNKAHPDMYYELNDDEPIREAVTDNYIPYVRCGKITPKKTSIVKFYKNGVQFKDGNVEQCDAVVFCTGFKPEFEYFEKSVLQTIKFDEKNEKMPIVMYKHTVHPDLPNLAMVGNINGLYFCGFENQGRWVAKLFAGQTKLPPRDEIDAEMKFEEMKRNKELNNQYPRGVYRKLIDSLAKEAHALPDFEQIRAQDQKTFEMLWKNGTITCHFSYNDPKTRHISLNLLKQVDDMINKKYFLTDEDLTNGFYNGDYLPTFKLAEQFSKNYKVPMHLFKDWQDQEIKSLLSTEVVTKLIEGFDYFDSDKSGTISNDEMPELLKWLGVNKRSVNELIEKMDVNKDGVVDLNEFLNYAEHLVSSGSHKTK